MISQLNTLKLVEDAPSGVFKGCDVYFFHEELKKAKSKREEEIIKGTCGYQAEEVSMAFDALKAEIAKEGSRILKKLLRKISKWT